MVSLIAISKRPIQSYSPQKQVPIGLLAATISVSCRMIPFLSGNCLGKLECAKTNSIELSKNIDNYYIPVAF